jgi:hypothetical protein
MSNKLCRKIAIFTCDKCGKKAHVKLGKGPPAGWSYKTNEHPWHYCEQCLSLKDTAQKVPSDTTVQKKSTMKNEGQIYTDCEQNCYVLLETKLGWMAFALGGHDTYGGIKQTQESCLDGLTPTGIWVRLQTVRDPEHHDGN